MNLDLLVDAFEDPGLWAVKLLVTLTVFFPELNNKFKVRAMEACVSQDISTAAPKDLLQERFARGKKSAAAAAAPVSINEPSIIAVAPHLTHSLASTSILLFNNAY